jgi:hypothetical protein
MGEPELDPPELDPLLEPDPLELNPLLDPPLELDPPLMLLVPESEAATGVDASPPPPALSFPKPGGRG